MAELVVYYKMIPLMLGIYIVKDISLYWKLFKSFSSSHTNSYDFGSEYLHTVCVSERK